MALIIDFFSIASNITFHFLLILTPTNNILFLTIIQLNLKRRNEIKGF